MSFVAGWNGQPGVLLTESRVRVGVPLHGGSFAVAADLLRPSGASDWILYVFLARGVVVFHSDFFAVIHDRSSAKSQVEGAHQLRDGVVVIAVTVAVVGADLVVVADYENRPAACRIDLRNLSTKLGRRELVDRSEHEVHRHLQFVVVGTVVLLELIDIRRPGFADQDGIGLVSYFSKLFHHIVNFGKLLVVYLVSIGIALFVGAGQDWVVGQLR